MLKSSWILAQLEPPKDVEALRQAARTSTPKFLGTDISFILVLVLILAAVLFFWAFFIRKRPKIARGALVVDRARKSSHSPEAYGSSGRRKRRKRRPDHPDNWGRNPTLGETGGLPAQRPDEPEDPPPAAPSSAH